MIGLTSKAACAAVIIYSRWRLRGEGTASAFLWRPSCLSSGKNLLRFPFISFIFLTGHLGKTQQWCGAERCLYVAVPNDHDWFGEGSKARPSRAKHSLVSRFVRRKPYLHHTFRLSHQQNCVRPLFCELLCEAADVPHQKQSGRTSLVERKAAKALKCG